MDSEILKDCHCNGVKVKPGDKIKDVSQLDAKVLIGGGHAKLTSITGTSNKEISSFKDK